MLHYKLNTTIEAHRFNSAVHDNSWNKISLLLKSTRCRRRKQISAKIILLGCIKTRHCFSSVFPTILWAQRKDVLFITVEVEDTEKEEISLTEKKLAFKSAKSICTY